MNKQTKPQSNNLLVYLKSGVTDVLLFLIFLISYESKTRLWRVMISEQKYAIKSKLWSHHPGLTLDLEGSKITVSQDRAQSGVAGMKWADTNLLYSLSTTFPKFRIMLVRQITTVQKQQKPIQFFHLKNEKALYQY